MLVVPCPQVKGVFTEFFSRCVKKILGAMSLNKMQRSFDLDTKLSTPETVIS